MGQNNAFSGHFGALNRDFQAIFDVPSNRLIPTNERGSGFSVSANALIASSLCCVSNLVTTTQVGQKWDSPELSHLLLRTCRILIQNKV